ncbi:MAG TPA: glycoside hydrolase, partial [Candidatus Hydrogenedentes bacterium]|nr:glycoside hydrolase [Candidatus Hydrogenedentota bacterium]
VNRSDTAFDGEMPLSAGGAAAALFDPMTGRSGMIPLRAEDGGVRVPLTLEPGQSCVVRVYDAAPAAPAAPWTAAKPAGPPLVVDGAWSVTFTDGGPALPAPLKLRRPAFWTESPGTEAFSGTAVYRAEFNLSDTAAAAPGWRLDLGDVRECAAVRVNGRDAGVVWMPPYRLDHVGPLPAGKNTLEVEVTNLAANRVAAMDRNKEKWQRAYFVNLDYKPFDASGWPVLPSGLAGPVTLTPLGGNTQ